MVKEAAGEKNLFDIVFMCKNILLAFIATVVMLFLCAVAATYLAVSEPVTDILVMVITGVCVLWSGFRAARHTKRQGLLQGALAGVIYMALLYLIGSLVFGELSFQTATALSMIIGIGCGAIGGVFGVNAGSKRKR